MLQEEHIKGFLRLMGIAALVGFAVVVYRAVRQYREDSVFDLGAATANGGGFGGEKRGISPSCWRSWPIRATKGQWSC